jgi:serine protease Do
VRALLFGACMFLVVASVVGCGKRASEGGSTTTTTTTATTTAGQIPTRSTERPPISLRDLVAKVRSGVVRVEVETCDYGALGTGFLLGPRLIATVEHVVDGARTIRLVRSGRSLGTATVIGSDAARDLALLRTSEPINGYRFKLSPRAPALGEDVAALGFPRGLPLSVTRGLVSGSDRTIPIEGINRRKLVQTDAALNHGNSGGPLISLDSGQVVGLVDLGLEGNGLAFAVSSQVAKPLLHAWAVSPQPVASQPCESEPLATTAPATSTPLPPPPQPSGDVAAVEDAITNHWNLIRQHRYEEAYDSFSPRLQSRFTRAGWVADKVRDQPKVSAIDFPGGVSVNGDTADANVGFTTVGRETSSTNTGCNVWNGTYHLFRVGGRWLIDDSHLTPSSC